MTLLPIRTLEQIEIELKEAKDQKRLMDNKPTLKT